MKFKTIFLLCFIALFFMNFNVPVVDVNLGMTTNAIACDNYYNGSYCGWGYGYNFSWNQHNWGHNYWYAYHWSHYNGGGSGGGQSVPEPSTMLLLGAGMIGVVGYRRFRKEPKQE